jgi:outer membrane protein assembly factor BamB
VVGGRDQRIVALGLADGAVRWRYEAGGRVDSSPVIAGKRVWCGVQSGAIVALALESGAEVWKFDSGSSVVASPSVADGRLLVGTVDGELYCFGARGQGQGQ